MNQHGPRVLNFKEAGFEQQLTPGTTPALIMVDFVKAYFEPGAQLYMGDDSCLAAASEVLVAAREAGILIVHTRVQYSEEGRDGGIFFQKVGALAQFVGETKLGQFVDPLTPASDEPVIVKQYASSFFGTSLSATLTAAGVDTVLIAGVSTSGCIRATAVDGIQHGFVPIVIRDAVGDRAASLHESNLFDIQSKYGEVWFSKEVIDYLRQLST